MDKEKIQFQPINSGLGFHPFSNGLPYAPEKKLKRDSKKPSSQGTGAVAAGRPTFVFPDDPPAQVQIQTLNDESRWSHIFKRSLAFLVDTLAGSIVCSFGLFLAFKVLGVSFENLYRRDFTLVVLVFLGVFNWTLITAQEIAFGTTVGKKLFGYFLSGTPIQILVRSILFVPLSALAGVSFLWILFDEEKRGLHDFLSKCQLLSQSSRP